MTIPKQPGSANQGLHRDGDLSLLDSQPPARPHRSNGEGRTDDGPSEEQTKRRREGECDDVGEDNMEDEKDERDEDSGVGGGLIFAMSTIWAPDGATAARGTTRSCPDRTPGRRQQLGVMTKMVVAVAAAAAAAVAPVLRHP